MKKKNRACRFIACLLSMVLLIAGMTMPAYANYDQEAAEAAESESVEDAVIDETQPEPDEETPFSSPGNGDLNDEIKNSSQKDFYTIRTKNNNVFYLIIDHSGNMENVYMLSLIDENDLAEFLEETTAEQEQKTPVIIPEDTKPVEEMKPDTEKETETPQEKPETDDGLTTINEDASNDEEV